MDGSQLRTHSSSPRRATSEGRRHQAGCGAERAALPGRNDGFSGPSQTAAPPPLGGRRAHHHTAFERHHWLPSPGLNTPGLDTAPPAGRQSQQIASLLTHQETLFLFF